MKWYIWAALAVVLAIVIYYATKKKTTTLAVATQVNPTDSQTKNTFNPFEIVKIS